MKFILSELMADLVHQKKSLVLILVKQTQRVSIIMLTIIICLLMENKYLDLKPTTKMSTF